MWLVWSIYKLITKTKLWNISKSVENLQFRKWQHTRVIYWIKVKKSIWRGDIENINMNIPLPQQIKLPMSVNDLDQSEYVPTAVCYDHSGHWVTVGMEGEIWICTLPQQHDIIECSEWAPATHGVLLYWSPYQ
jgi:hypothetical protein